MTKPSGVLCLGGRLVTVMSAGILFRGDRSGVRLGLLASHAGQQSRKRVRQGHGPLHFGKIVFFPPVVGAGNGGDPIQLGVQAQTEH